jgi:cytoskeletal protein CcmA (bactofilin family)
MGILKQEEKSIAVSAGTYNAILDQGSEFEGKLTFEGTVRIDGVYKGEIISDATLIVGETGKVQADIKVRALVISGEVNGNIEAIEKVELCAPAVVRGNIKSPNLMIEEGVIFEGTCNMTASITGNQGFSKNKGSDKTDKSPDKKSSGVVAIQPD